MEKARAGVFEAFVRAIVADGLQQFRLLFHRQRQESFAETPLGFFRQPLDSLAIGLLRVTFSDFLDCLRPVIRDGQGAVFWREPSSRFSRSPRAEGCEVDPLRHFGADAAPAIALRAGA